MNTRLLLTTNFQVIKISNNNYNKFFCSSKLIKNTIQKNGLIQKDKNSLIMNFKNIIFKKIITNIPWIMASFVWFVGNKIGILITKKYILKTPNTKFNLI